MRINNRQLVTIPAAVLAVWCVAAAASAQSAPAVHMDFTHGTTLSVFAGVNAASSRAGLLGGAAFGWELTPRLAIEGTGSWLDRGRFANAFAADLKTIVSVTSPRNVVPFIAAGVGFYRASFERAQATMPDFYARRMGTKSGMTADIFVDPTIVMGGGANVFVTNRMSLRPEIDMKIIVRDAQRYLMTVAAMRVTYHFEEHPITPARH